MRGAREVRYAPAVVHPDIDALLAAGRHAEAARLLEARGEYATAQKIRESIWDFQGAADLARLRGDVVDELRLRLEAGDAARTSELLPLLPQLDAAEQARAETILEARQLHLEAAELADRRGALLAAERLYLLAHHPLFAARIAERRGDLKRAGGLLEALLADRTTAPRERTHARSELARLYASLGRYFDGIALLEPTVVPEGAPPAESADERALLDRQRVHYFHRLGLTTAARAVLGRLHAGPTPRGTTAAPPLASPEALDELVEIEQHRERRQLPELVAGRYRVLAYVGAGAVGRVYLAHDEVADRRVALKLVPPPVDARLRAGYRQFLQEVKTLYQLRHPGLVQLHDVDEQNGLLCTEFLDGGSLADRSLPLSPATVRQILDEVLAALAVVHAHEVVHRDIKPANLLVAPSGRIKIADFGAAHLRSHGVTQTAGFVGTLGYMSPEQIRGETPTFAVDLYGAGCTLYQLLTGRLPFAGPDFAAQHLAQPPPMPSATDPRLAGWDGIVKRALQKRPADRFPSATAMRDAVLKVALDAGALPALGTPAATATLDGDAGPRLLVQLASARGELWRAVDERIGRELEIELLSKDEAEREAQRRWLIPLAAAGPVVQRIYGVDADRVRFEALEGPPATAIDDATAAALEAALGPLWQTGQTHGALASSLVQTRTRVVLRTAGIAPSTLPTADERQQLRAIPRRADGSRTAR